jgi:hypothetical protein
MHKNAVRCVKAGTNHTKKNAATVKPGGVFDWICCSGLAGAYFIKEVADLTAKGA